MPGMSPRPCRCDICVRVNIDEGMGIAILAIYNAIPEEFILVKEPGKMKRLAREAGIEI